MHANDVEVVRVYARRVGSPVSDNTFPSNAAFEVVIEAEAGSTKHGDGGSYDIQLVVRDLSSNTVIVQANNLAGNFGDANWPNLDLSHAFNVPAQGAGQQGHIYEAVAVLTAGNVNPDVSSARSDLFIITPP
jgi:hypothetical protein